MQFREPTGETHKPEIEIGERHPNGAGAKLPKRGQGKAEDVVVGLVVGEDVVQNFCDVAEGDRARVGDFGGQRRLHDLAGVEARDLALLLHLIVRTDNSHGLESAPEAAFGFLRRARHAAHRSALLCQPQREMRADETGRAGDENCLPAERRQIHDRPRAE